MFRPRISRRTCVCFFFEICVLVSTRTVLFWKVTGCCLLFRCLTSCQLRAKFSWIAASCSGRNNSPVSVPDCRSWTEQIRSAAELVGINTYTKVKRICSAGVAETQWTPILWKLAVRHDDPHKTASPRHICLWCEEKPSLVQQLVPAAFNNMLMQLPLNAVIFFNVPLTLGIKKEKRNTYCLIYGRQWHL